jgi:hypothetical protein
MPRSLCSATWKCSRASNRSTDISALPQIFVSAHPISDIEALPLLELKLELPVRCRPTYHRPRFNSVPVTAAEIRRTLKVQTFNVQTSNHVVDSIRASPPLEFSRARLKLTFELSTPPRIQVAPYQLLYIAVERTLCTPDLSAPRWAWRWIRISMLSGMDADESEGLNGYCHYRRWQAPPSSRYRCGCGRLPIRLGCGMDIDTDTDTLTSAVALKRLFYPPT